MHYVVAQMLVVDVEDAAVFSVFGLLSVIFVQTMIQKLNLLNQADLFD